MGIGRNMLKVQRATNMALAYTAAGSFARSSTIGRRLYVATRGAHRVRRVDDCACYPELVIAEDQEVFGWAFWLCDSNTWDHTFDATSDRCGSRRLPPNDKIHHNDS